MKVLHKWSSIFLLASSLLLLIFALPSFAQICGTGTPTGVNLVCNGDFESGNTCFNTDYKLHSAAADVSCGTCFRNWSNPDEYEVTTNVTTQFHSGFPNVTDHSSGTGNHMMSVDGSCSAGLSVWCQSVTVQPSTNYYFTTWLTSLYASNPAQLRFSINGTQVGLPINAPPTVGTWISYTYNWFSGATSGNVDICIENLTTAGCGSGNDFAIDDISFVAGCAFAVQGPQPNLGPDVSLCGTGGSVTLNPNLGATTANRADVHYVWSTGVTGFGTNPAVRTITVSAPGSYSVCIDSAGSCIKSDIINVTVGFNIDLGPDVTLCNPTSALLDAVYTNGTTSYVWSLNGTTIPGANSRTYLATSPGTYRVTVTDASCGFSDFDEVVISTNAAIPNNVTFCPPAAANLSVTPNPTGTFQWYANPTGGAPLASGTAYSPSPAVTTTYYVQDVSTFSYTVGPNNGTNNSPPAGFTNGYGVNSSPDKYIRFDALKSFTITAVTVYGKVYNPNENFTVSVTLTNSSNVDITTVTRNVIGPPTVPPGNDWRFVIPVGITVPIGTGWRLSNEGPSTGAIWFAQGGSNTVAWPYSIAGVISLTGMDASYGWCGTACYGPLYNWEITAGIDCQRVPVTATVSCTVPITLLSFTAKATEKNSAIVRWETGNETNTDYFVVEKSEDGIHFIAATIIKAKGTANEGASYAWSDASLNSGKNYYRLVEYDRNGNSYTSEIQSVYQVRKKLVVYPNPSGGLYHIGFDGALDESVQVEVFNKLGQQLFFEEVTESNGYLNKTVDLRQQSNGIYYLKIQSANDYWIEQIVKE